MSNTRENERKYEPKQATFVYAPRIITDDPDNKIVKNMLEKIEKQKPNTSAYPNINVTIASSFVEKSPSVNIEYKEKPQDIHEKTNIRDNIANSPTMVYSPIVYATEDTIEESLIRFNVIQQTRPTPELAKQTGKNITVSHKFEITGQTYTLADLLKKMGVNAEKNHIEPNEACNNKQQSKDPRL